MSYVKTKYFEGFLDEIDPYKAVDLFGVWYLTFKQKKTIAQCVKLLNSLKGVGDLNKILKHG